MNAAPPTDATDPARVIPPEVPAGTRLPETMDRGTPPKSVPSSVAQVSAADAASAPIPTASQIGDWDTRLANAAAVKSPPFATTCHTSRSPVFATIPWAISSLRRAPSFESAMPEAKNAISRIPQLHPAALATVPDTTAPAAPLRDNALPRTALDATPAERSAPIIALMRGSDRRDDP